MKENKINKERFISHLLRHGYLDRPEDFDKVMQIIPSTAREILEARWGFTDSGYCPNFRQLGSKLDISPGSAEREYLEAKRTLYYAKYIAVLNDYQFFEPEKAYLIGRLAYDCHLFKEKREVDGEYLLSLVEGNTLTEREKKVLDLKYGLTDGKFKTYEQVGSILSITNERVRQIQHKAFRRLRLKVYRERCAAK